MNSSVISYVDLLYRRRLAALQSVDDMIENLVQTLEAFPPRGFPGASSALDETYIIYTADNGEKCVMCY
jgi:arylsulfatase